MPQRRARSSPSKHRKHRRTAATPARHEAAAARRRTCTAGASGRICALPHREERGHHSKKRRHEALRRGWSCTARQEGRMASTLTTRAASGRAATSSRWRGSPRRNSCRSSFMSERRWAAILARGTGGVTFHEYVESKRARHNHQFSQLVAGSRLAACDPSRAHHRTSSAAARGRASPRLKMFVGEALRS